MAHDEAPIPKERILNLILKDSSGSQTPSTAGRVMLSGSKLWFDTGTTWEIVTSA